MIFDKRLWRRLIDMAACFSLKMPYFYLYHQINYNLISRMMWFKETHGKTAIMLASH
jgi:hypothetical protein